jgi:hypothetical protein
MRLYKFLNEELSVSAIFDILKHDCMPFLKEYSSALKKMNDHNSVFQRSTHDPRNESEIEKKTRRKDRRPSDTPYQISEYLDDLFKKRFGWKPRGEGVFTEPSGTSPWSSIKQFIPIGKYRYLWSNDVEDLYLILRNRFLKGGNLRGKHADYTDLLEDSTIKEFIDDVIKSYKNDDMYAALTTTKNCEIMFDCDKYYLIQRVYDDALIKKIKNEI